jgi:predicted ATPase/class 3 adenylate cyclase
VAQRPTGTVTFLFTDIEGSTRLLHELGDSYRGALEDHRRLLREAFEGHAGYEVDTQGDAFFVAFSRAQDAVRAAAEAQRALAAHEWPGKKPLRVRMGIHTCEATATDNGYVGIGVHRGARVASAGHGGQVLLSQTTRDLLAEQGDDLLTMRDLGEHRLKDLTQPQRLYQLAGEGLASEFPALKTLENRPTNLPAQATPLVGRVQELEELCELVRADGRIVTLTGPGGTGKTRLALQAAAELLESFRDGAFFVPLAAVIDPDLVLPAVAQTLSVTSAGIQTLEGYLADKELLLVLDNLEQILEVAPHLAELCAQGAGMKLLITSREPLRLSGERVYPVPPLDLERDAVELFVDRACAAKPDFELTSENASAVGELCARLDGLPLAIELAAARISILTPTAMLDRLGDRLQLLTGGARDLPERQRTLRDTLEWSYDLLAVNEQQLFGRLGIFAGGFTLESAEGVCDAELDELASLVDKSLVRHDDGRYSMLETIRAYALERLGELGDELASRHADYLLALADETYRKRHERFERGLDRIEAEHDNLRAALDWLHVHDPQRELELAGRLGSMWLQRSYLQEGRERLEQALHTQQGGQRAQARALALRWLGAINGWLGETSTALGRLDESLELWRELGDRDEEAGVLINRAWASFIGGDLQVARRDAEGGLELRRELGDPGAVNAAIGTLGQILVAEGDVERAEPLAREAVASSRELGDARTEHFAHHYLGDCALIRGDAEAAEPHYRRGLELAVEIGDRVEICTELQGMAMATAGIGQAERALRLGGAAEAGFESLGVDLSGIAFWVELLERYLGAARASLRAEGDAAWEAGRQLDVEHAVELALSEG